MSVLKIQNLKKTFRKTGARSTTTAVNGISFTIEPGTITGFLGANGAGKTTTIKCILGLVFPDSGDIRFFGDQVLSSEVKSRIGFLPERPYFYDYLTGEEFLKFYGELSPNPKLPPLRARIDQMLKRVGLEHARTWPLRSYSKGMLQRIGIAQALIHEPEFLILDEPMSGLDPDGRLSVRQLIQEIASHGTAVFFSSHLLPDAEQICKQLVILRKGDLVYQGTMAALLDRIDSQYQLSYMLKSNQVLTQKLATLTDLQTNLDLIRKQGGTITEVKAERQTLEEAFVSIAFDQSAAENLK